VEASRLAQLSQGQIILLGQQSPHLAAMSWPNRWLAAGKTMTGSDVAGAPALLQEFLDQA
jgi:hypothetical protein